MYHSTKEMETKLKIKNKIKSLPAGLGKFSHVRGNQQSIFHGLMQLYSTHYSEYDRISPEKRK